MSFLWGPFGNRIIDDFEDNDLSEYDLIINDPDGSVSIATTGVAAKIGSYGIEFDMSVTPPGTTNGIVTGEALSDSGLDNYPGAGDTVSLWFYLDYSRTAKGDKVRGNASFRPPGTDVNLTVDARIREESTRNGDTVQLTLELDGGGSADQIDFDNPTLGVWRKVIFAWQEDHIAQDGAVTSAAIWEKAGGSLKGSTEILGSLNESSDTKIVSWETALTGTTEGETTKGEVYFDHAILVDRSDFISSEWTRSLTDEELDVGESEDFTDQSTTKHGTVDEWVWDWGDGTEDTTENASHAYGASGDYEVLHQSRNDQGMAGVPVKKSITVVNILDGFEDQSLSNYSGTTGSYTITTGASNQRSYGVESDPNQDSGEIVDTSATVQQGDNVSAELQVNKTNGVAHFLFGVQDTSNYYTLHIDHENQEAVLQRIESNTTDPVIDSTGFSFNTGEWFTAQIQWSGSGDFTVDLLDKSDSSQASLSGTDTNFTSGGIGWRADNDTCYFDFARILVDESVV